MPSLLLLAMVSPGPAFALDKTHLEQPATALAAGPRGWSGTLSLGANISLGSSSHVVGQTDGTTFNLGLNLGGMAEYRNGGHEWRTTASLAEMFSRTPSIDRFLKTSDLLALESLYLHSFTTVTWLGPFVRIAMQTPIFEGFDVRSSTTTYAIKRPGVATPQTVKADELRLTDPLAPLLLKESAGAYARPLDRPWLRFEIHLGGGARQNFADEQLVIDDDSDTASIIEVKQVETYYEVGAEAALLVNGVFLDDRITYRFGIEALLPFYTSGQSGELNMLERTNVEIQAQLGLKIVSWASITYQLKALRLPMLVDRFQVQNNLLLSLSYSMLWEPKAL